MKRLFIICFTLLLSGVNLNAGGGEKVFTKNDAWVEDIIKNMSLEEKAGQVVFPWAHGNYMSKESADYERLMHLVKDLKVGGFVFFLSNIYDQAIITNILQKESKIPLLIAADFERGVAQRAVDATLFPYNMGIGAADDEELTYEMGRIIAAEGRAIGVHQNYAPVSDINNNPYNPIINVRAFGEDIDLVERLSNSFLKGIQDGGMIATSKHFPGHGNTNVDSHRELPLIAGDAAMLEKTELAPFVSNIENGVMSFMIGHLAVPAFEPDTKLPSTLSPKIVKELLQEKLGFKGLVVTDAMNMHAITNSFTTGDATVKALQAGNDAILFPHDADEAVNAIIAAVRKGDITEERLDASVRKILLAKKWAGLDKNRLIEIEKIPETIGKRAHWETALKLARKSITLVKDENSVIPLAPGKKYVHIAVIDERSGGTERYFTNQLRSRAGNVETRLILMNSGDGDLKEALEAAEEAEAVILSTYLKVRAFEGTLGLSEEQAEAVKDILALDKPVIFAAHGNPYILGAFPEAKTYLCNYGDTEVSEAALAEALFGEIAVTGRLPVSIPNTDYKTGDGIKKDQSALLGVSGSFEGIGIKKFENVDQIIEEAIKDSAFPGAVVLAAKDGEIIYNKAYGRMGYDYTYGGVETSTIYDLASVSKVIGTTTAAMICLDRGLINLDAKVSEFIPEFAVNGKDKITIRNLLVHNSGFIPFKRFYEKYTTAEEVIKDIYESGLEYETGSEMKYSDLGMITLAKVIEKVTGKTLDRFCKDEIFDPLGMKDTYYAPPAELKERIAPTELDNYWRNRMLRGEVHDEAASMLNGVAGHAGLFSTAPDLSILLQMLLQKGSYQGRAYIKAETINNFIKKQSEQSSRALGWDTRSGRSSSGEYFGPNSYGHTGYTGTSVWTDPDRKLFVIFLTNRVHPTRENSKISRVRPVLHDAIIEAIEDSTKKEAQK